MGRPPCCDRVGIKKGPWTPEEDIILVSYIQEHGPGNWRSVPTNTGLLRCSKSCRLRWTNYLRPGIKRGNFTPHEEGMIVHLQALLGNKWAAIASYLPQRTDNDIKNYWNTHLKKKLKKFQSGLDPKVPSDSTNYQFMSMSFSDNNRHVSALKLNQTSSLYASSAENISRLLEGWMKSSPKSSTLLSPQQEQLRTDGSSVGNNCNGSNSVAPNSIQCYRPHIRQEEEIIISNDEFETILSFDNLNGMGWEKSSSNSIQKEADSSGVDDKTDIDKEEEEEEEKLENHPPLSFIENWLLDETAGHVNVEEAMEFPTMF